MMWMIIALKIRSMFANNICIYKYNNNKVLKLSM